MKIKILGGAVVALLLTVGCQKYKTGNNEVDILRLSDKSLAEEISIQKFEDSPAYEDAHLSLAKPISSLIHASGESGEIDFSFDVKNYELGAETERHGIAELLSNSDKGQHIHFILDNQPYSAHYEKDFKKEIPEGTHHLVAFLSRSYHESVKNPNSFISKKIVVGKESDDVKVELDKPTLIYSRPKGDYTAADADNLLLDFFLLNTTLSEDGNKVRATINGQEFMITEWSPYIIKGLPIGEVSIRLELLDAEGNLIPGAYNDVTRVVALK